MKVLVYGSANIDRTYQADHFVQAGDTFTGYFLTSLLGGEEPGEALRTASVASGIAVSRPGASQSIPSLGEVECVDLSVVSKMCSACDSGVI